MYENRRRKNITKINKDGKTTQERTRAHALILSNDGYKSQELATIYRYLLL